MAQHILINNYPQNSYIKKIKKSIASRIAYFKRMYPVKDIYNSLVGYDRRIYGRSFIRLPLTHALNTTSPFIPFELGNYAIGRISVKAYRASTTKGTLEKTRTFMKQTAMAVVHYNPVTGEYITYLAT